MGFFRVCFYGSLLTGTLVALHFAEPEAYAPVRTHALYVDFVTPVMTQLEARGRPLLVEALRHPTVAALGARLLAQNLEGNTKPLNPQELDEAAQVEATKIQASNLSMPSQMQFSLAQSGKGLSKRSVLSTEGSDASSFEMPDGSRLWLDRDSVVEVGGAGTNDEGSELLLRVEKGVMHIERARRSKARVLLITNSGIRHELAPRDGWMATAQMGVADKKAFPDAHQKASGRYLDYVRRATLEEARELAQLLKADGRREEMLYQDQLRIAADDEDEDRKKRESSNSVSAKIANIPLQIPSRRGGKDLSGEAIRKPASIELASTLRFPARAPASVSSLDEGTRMASEARILKWADAGQCPEALRFFSKLREEHALADSDAWTHRMKQTLSQRCP